MNPLEKLIYTLKTHKESNPENYYVSDDLESSIFHYQDMKKVFLQLIHNLEEYLKSDMQQTGTNFSLIFDIEKRIQEYTRAHEALLDQLILIMPIEWWTYRSFPDRQAFIDFLIYENTWMILISNSMRQLFLDWSKSHIGEVRDERIELKKNVEDISHDPLMELLEISGSMIQKKTEKSFNALSQITQL